MKLASLSLPGSDYDTLSNEIRKSYGNPDSVTRISYVLYDENKTGNSVQLQTEGYNGKTGFAIKPETEITTPYLNANNNNIDLDGDEITYSGIRV